MLSLSATNVRMIVGRDNTLIVARIAEPFVFVISPGGRVRRVGRAGEGPGELRIVSAIGLLGDTLWVADELLRRLTFWPVSSATSVTTTSITGQQHGEKRYVPFALMGDGTSFGLDISDAQQTRQGLVGGIGLLQTRRDGSLIRRLPDRLDVWSMQHRIPLGGNRNDLFRQQPLLDRSIVATDGTGRWVALVNQRSTSGRPAAAPSVTAWSTAPSARWRRDVPLPREPLDSRTREQVVSAFSGALNTLAQQLGRPAIPRRAFEAELYVPAERTPVTDVIVSAEGWVLLRGNDWARTQVRHVLLDATGRTVGTFDLPFTQTVKALRGMEVYSVVEDADGLLSIVRQTLRRAR